MKYVFTGFFFLNLCGSSPKKIIYWACTFASFAKSITQLITVLYINNVTHCKFNIWPRVLTSNGI
jgi:hypothetical protein